MSQEIENAVRRATTDSLIQSIFRATLPSKVLCLAHSAPAIFLTAPSQLVLLGSEFPTSPVSATTFDFRKVDNNFELVAALADYAKRGEQFDLVFIDHDHRIKALIEQIEAISKVSHDTTVLLFDDAVPPTLEMANDEPGTGWWVGSVWILPHLDLFKSSEYSICADTLPTGLYAALGRPSIDFDMAIARAQELLARALTIDDIRSELRLATEGRVAEFIALTRRTAQERQYFSVSPASYSDYQSYQLEEISQEKEMILPVPLVFADLSDGTVKHKFDTAAHDRIENQTLVQFRDATLMGTNAIFAGGLFFWRYTKVCGSDLERIASERGYNNEGTGIFKSEGVYFLPKNRTQGAVPLRGRFLLATPDERDNWGMWLLVALPSVIYYLTHRDDYDGLICIVEKPWQAQFLSALGVADSDVIPHVISKAYTVDRLDILCRGARNLGVTDFDCACYADVVERFTRHYSWNRSDENNSGKYRKIFVSRLSSSRDGYRMLVEEPDLIRRLEKIGFVSIEPEKFSLVEQIRIFSQAEIIVGLGGAGMFNAVFAKPGTLVVTIEGSAKWVHPHANLFTSCKLVLGIIFGREDMSDPRPIHRKWNIDVDAVLNALAPIVGNSRDQVEIN